MDAWLEIVIRQFMLYSLPVVISLSIAGMLESALLPADKRPKNPLHSLTWKGSWLPFVASILLGRAVIIAPPRPVEPGVRTALIHLAAHAVLCIIGWLLYAWALAHQLPTGLPPLHHWWAKVLMYFNLCMACLHLLPLPGMLIGEWLLSLKALQKIGEKISAYTVWILVLIAALPLLDALTGQTVIFPIYEMLASQAAILSR